MEGTQTDKMTLDDVGSGIVYPQELRLAIKDYEGQTVSNNNLNQILVTPVNSSVSSISGTNTALLEGGVATFDNLIAIASPGSQNITYRATSKALNSAKINAIYGESASANTIMMNFRHCKPGEILGDQNKCSECSPGTFSLQWNSQACTECMANAVCLGKDEISVDSGYWRRSANSTLVVECINKNACLGEYEPNKTNPINCNKGYKGNLCTQCEVSKGVKYQKVNDFE